MLVDVYNHIKQNPHFNKLIGDDYLFVEYKCPINAEEYQLWSDSHLITYVISGRKDWIAQDKVYPIETGDALFVSKGVYSTKQYFEDDYCVMLFFINDDFITNFLCENQNLKAGLGEDSSHEPIFRLNVDDSFEALIKSLFNYFKQSSPIPRELVEIKFKELLYNIILNPGNQQLTEFLASLNQSKHRMLEKVMMKNYQHDLKLDEFARMCGSSLSTFKRDFQEHFKETPGKWITQKRLEHARSLLLHSDLNINDVCYESGFKNNSHFNSAFKEKYGFPPKQYREKVTQ